MWTCGRCDDVIVNKRKILQLSLDLISQNNWEKMNLKRAGTEMS